MLPAALGCGAFFTCEGKTSCGTSSGGTDAGDIVFAANRSSTGIYAYYLSSGKMYTVAGEPFATSFLTSSMAVAPGNTYLFVSGGLEIYSYAVSTAGVVSAQEPEATNSFPQVSMDISSDGKWLASLDLGTSIPNLNIYSISGGTLTIAQQIPLSSLTSVINPEQVKFSPKYDYLAVALSGGGTDIFKFTTSATAPVNTSGFNLTAGASTSADNAIAWDNNENLYIGRTTVSATTTGIYTLQYADIVNSTASPTLGFVTSDSGSRALAFASTYAYLYSASTSSNTVNGYSVANGVLTPLGTSTTAPTTVEALAVDSSGLNLLAAGISNTGLQLYTVSSGALSSSNNAATGTTAGYPVLAVTH